MPFSVVYAGTPRFAVPALEALSASPHRLLAVLTQPDRPAGRGRALAMSAVKSCAIGLGLPVLQPPTLKESATVEAIRAFGADLLVVVAYGLLLPPAVLALPRQGCLNVHASLLPRWRGAAPVQRALLAGDAETGVGIMQLEAGLDTGAVYASERTPIGARETAAELSERLAIQGGALLVATLAALEAGTAIATPQSAAGVSYAHKLAKQESPLDWRLGATELDRQVRAFLPWPVATAAWRGEALRVHAAEPARGEGSSPGTIERIDASGIDVATGRGALRLTRLQAPGRAIVSASEFANAASRQGFKAGDRFDGLA